MREPRGGNDDIENVIDIASFGTTGSNQSADIDASGGNNGGSGDGSGEAPKRKRGRPPGSGAGSGRTGGGSEKQSKTKPAHDLSALAGLLMALHVGLVIKTGSDVWALDESEANDLIRAFVNAQKHFAPEVSQKAIDIGLLIAAIGRTYGMRAVSYAMEVKSRPPHSGPTINA